MANPLYGQNKADNVLDAQEKMVKVDLNGGAAITAVTHAAGDHGGAWLNPEGESIIVTGFYLDVTTAATGTPTVDVGVAADVSTPIIEGGTNGKGAVKMSSTQYITIDGSASLAGMVASFYVKYFVISKV